MIVTPLTNNAPFPANATYVSHGGPLLIQFAGSARAKAIEIISMNLILDGATVATTKVITNEAPSHKTLVPVVVLNRCGLRILSLLTAST